MASRTSNSDLNKKVTLGSPEGESRRSARSAAKRMAILKAARSIFAKRGFTDTMVDHIAAECGVAKGTIYLYFESKQAIFMDVLLADCRQMAEVSKETMNADGLSWKERVRSFMEVRLAYCEQHPDFMRILLTELHAMILQNRPIDPRLPLLVQEAEFQLTQMFAVAMAKGEIKQVDPHVPAVSVIALTKSLLEMRLKGGTSEALRAQLSFSIEMLSGALSS